MAKPNSIAPGLLVKSVASAALFLCLLGGCEPAAAPTPPEQVEFAGAIMGTTYHIKVVGAMSEAESIATAEAIENSLKEVDVKMSTYKPDSEVSQLNAAAAGVPVSLSEDTFRVFSLARRVNEESGGAFDITVGPLVNAWGFGPKTPDDAPSDTELEALKALTGADKITLDPEERTATKASEGVYCDLSAIAKGYAADRAALAIGARDHKNYMVEIGGEVRTSGTNSRGVPWNLAIEKPTDGERAIELIVALSGVSLATSGDYRNFYVAEGKRMSHTIDPATGRPVAHQLASVSVIHPECALADAYATAIMVLGPEHGLAFAEKLGLAALLIVHGESDTLITKQTPSFAEYVLTR